MPGEESLQGRAPAIDSREALVRTVDDAFDYRGDVTLERSDRSEVIGYLFNRSHSDGVGFVEMMLPSGERLRLSLDEIKGIRFTGKDMSSGPSWEAWQRRREANAGSEGASA